MQIKYLTAIFILALISCTKNPAKIADPPTLSINDISLPEGNTGNTAFTFQLTLGKASSSTVSVHYSTVEGTAKNTEDFIPVNDQVISFAPNETTKNIVINVVADDLKENDENFSVRLSNPSNATLIRETGTATIKNDDTRINISNTGYDAPTTYAGYTLAWSDEFNGPVVDANSWTYETGDGCPNLCGWGNNELEYYTNSTENLFFQDGKMIIQAKQESYGGKNYTSARIKTDGKKQMKFGRIDIRAILPVGKGLWPAMWLLPQNSVYGTWPKSGELDMMELLGHEPNKVYGTLHYGPGPGSTQINKNYILPAGNFHDQFHVFSLEWKADQIKWFIDGNLYATANKTDFGTVNYPFNENFFLIMNLAVGGNFPGNPDASTTFPQYMIVDYVRWYQ